MHAARILGARITHDAAVWKGGGLLGFRCHAIPNDAGQAPFSHTVKLSADYLSTSLLTQVTTLPSVLNIASCCRSEDSFRDAVLQGALYLTANSGPFNPLESEESGTDPVLRETVLNLLHSNPLHRWSAEQTLAYLQFDFAQVIQRIWRGWLARRQARRLISGIEEMQAIVRGALVRQNYVPDLHSSYAV